MASRRNSPPDLEVMRVAVRRALKDIVSAGPPRSDAESMALMLSSRTKASRSLPAYHLLYFLLVDLLEYPNVGKWEKVAWTVPIRYQDRLYSIDHAKFGVGIFAPTFEPLVLRSGAKSSAPPSEQAEADAVEIAAAVSRAVSIARPYFEWRANEAVSTSQLNVTNASNGLYARYVFFRDRFRSLLAEADARRDEFVKSETRLPDGTVVKTGGFPAYSLRREANWYAQAAIEAFYAWTEHVFVHLAILQGKVTTGDAVADLARDDWKTKFQAALDISTRETKQHYDTLLGLREQIRNFMAHGAFGKRGEAFSFHSGAGAVPVLLTRSYGHPYTLGGDPAFDEDVAIASIESFIEHLWSGPRAPANALISTSLPTILTYAVDGTYAGAMKSAEDMAEFVERLIYQADTAANMDW